MFKINTNVGYQDFTNAYYKNGSGYIGVKKVFLNSDIVTNKFLCSCQFSTSDLKKATKEAIRLNEELLPYLEGVEATALELEIKELKSTLESATLELVEIAKQKTISDSKILTNSYIKPLMETMNTIYGRNYSYNGDVEYIVEITPSKTSGNPAIKLSEDSNYVSVGGKHYYIVDPALTVEESTTNIQSLFDLPVALNFRNYNDVMNGLKSKTEEYIETNLDKIDTIKKQQLTVTKLADERKLNVLNGVTLQNTETDTFIKDFYNINSVIDYATNNVNLINTLNSTTSKTTNLKAVDLPDVLDLNWLEKYMLAWENLNSSINVPYGPIPSSYVLSQIYTSSDIYDISGTKHVSVFTSDEYMSYIISEIEDIVYDLDEAVSATKVEYPYYVNQTKSSPSIVANTLIETQGTEVFLSALKKDTITLMTPTISVVETLPTRISTQINSDTVIIDDSGTEVVLDETGTAISLQEFTNTVTIPRPNISVVGTEMYISSFKGMNLTDITSETHNSILETNVINGTTSTVVLNGTIKQVNDNTTEDIMSLTSTTTLDLTGLNNISSGMILGTPIRLSDGTLSTTTGDTIPIVIEDGADGNKYLLTIDGNGSIESVITTDSLTNNNYIIDESTSTTYKFVSTDGYISISEI